MLANTTENVALIEAILDEIETTHAPERLWITSWSSDWIGSIQARADLDSIAKYRARDILKVIRTVGKILLRG